jgi:hypothetical protein
MNTAESYAVLDAIEKAAKERKGDFRYQLEGDTRALYDMGAKQQEVKLFGEKVGTITATTTKEELYVSDQSAYLDYCIENGKADSKEVFDFDSLNNDQKQVLRDTFPEHFDMLYKAKDDALSTVVWVKGQAMDSATGEVVPGVSFAESAYKGMMVRIKGEAVMDILARNDLSLAGQLLIGGNDAEVD